jgi:hypothetical protein
MGEPQMTLAQFREQLQHLMHEPGLRPFVCDGSPLSCEVFIVGFNPATSMDQPFWHYWSDEAGFDKKRFMRDYLANRGLSEPEGVRARIERIVRQLPIGTALETNVCSKPTKTAAELRSNERATDIFRFLLKTIRPRLVYAHSNHPITYFENLTGARDFATGAPRTASYRDLSFLLVGTSGPLFRMAYPAADALGQQLKRWLQAAA